MHIVKVATFLCTCYSISGKSRIKTIKMNTLELEIIKGEFIMKIKSVFFEYIKNNKKTFVVLLIFFFIGICLGIAFINNANENQIQEITVYVNSLKDNIKSAKDVNKSILFMQSIKQNIIFMLVIWFFGCTIFGSFLIYIAIIYKGFSIGYTISAIIATLGVKSGMAFVFISLILQNLILLPVLFIISDSGIKMYKNLMKNRFMNIKTEFLRHTIIMLISLVFVTLASFIEVYVSTSFLIFFKEIL